MKNYFTVPSWGLLSFFWACWWEKRSCYLRLAMIWSGWCFGKFLIFPYIGNNTPKWRTHIFQRGWNHQPDLIVTLSLMLQDPPRGQFSGESFGDHVQQGPCMDSVDLVTSILWYKRYIYIYTYFIFLWCVLYIYIYTFTHTHHVLVYYIIYSL